MHICMLCDEQEYEEQQREIDKLESYITRFGAKMSHAASAQSKRKMLVPCVLLHKYSCVIVTITNVIMNMIMLFRIHSYVIMTLTMLLRI